MEPCMSCATCTWYAGCRCRKIFLKREAAWQRMQNTVLFTVMCYTIKTKACS